MQRLIVILGGAAIFFESLLSVFSKTLNVDIPDALVSVTAFLLGGATAAWLLDMLHNHNSDRK